MKRVILLCLLFISILTYGQVNLGLGLRAYYPFTGNANDVSGNGNNPVFNNATLTADRLGNPNSAYHFNGTDNFIQIPNSSTINTTNTMSLCAWVRPMGYYTGTCHGNSVMMKGDADYLTGNYLMRFDDGPFSNFTNCSSVVDIAHENFYGADAASAPPGYTPYIQTNQWYSVIVTYDGTTAKVYVNCILVISNPQNSVTFTNAYDLFLGKLNAPAFPYWFNGDMDEVRIYDRAINQDEVNVLGGCVATTSCDTWLQTPGPTGSYAAIGDLDVSGNKLTVEANFNRTSPVNPVGGYGFLVSKHTNPSDVNYALWPGGCAITTVNGEVFATENCAFELNKTYHVAMVYDGVSLKYYRDGFLHSQTPVTGNLILNDLITCIAQNSPGGPVIYPFIGNMNEVRIWNVARTQAQLQAYMNNSLPNPTTQPGLLGYYVFDNLLNKQGNATYNGTLIGAAAINSTNPNCNFIADSCGIIVNSTGISHIINEYTPVLGFLPCENKITVEDATKFNPGDTVLMIQMKGAVIDSTNTAAFGNVTNYKNSGNYEFNYVKSKAGNIIELKNKLTRQYDIPYGKVQLIRVPYYNSVVVSDTLTCLPWDGNKGGVLAFNVRDTLTLNADINVSGKGFKGGKGINTFLNSTNCGQTGFYYPGSSLLAALKGENITIIQQDKASGRGSPSNGGGGGQDHNSGGGGGSNGSPGGLGGYEWQNCPSSPFDNRGLGGKALAYSNAANKIFLGGGGGAGHCNNPTGFNSDGGDGGGIIIIKTGKIQHNGKQIISNGDDGAVCVPNSTFGTCHEAMGGGGAGGTILIDLASSIDNANIKLNGGKGADMTGESNGKLGPGGGGSAGVLWLNNASLPGNFIVTSNGGLNGVDTNIGNDPWGATPGQNGITVFSLVLPVDNILFTKNIDSVRIKDSNTACFVFNFTGFGYTNTNPIASWQWYFGDAGTANTQNASHTYAAAGTFTVKLVVTDINGCKDSVTKPITVTNCTSTAGISHIINEYTPVLGFLPCENKIVVEDATKFNPGDTVLMIQMKGAVIDSTNTATFGNITDYKNSGNYEFNYVKAKAGNVIELKNKLTRQYDIPDGKVQLIRVPYYNSVVVSDTLTCLPWDGKVGGVLVLNARDTVELNADINTTGRGFKKGIMHNSGATTYTCGVTDYYFQDNTIDAAGKGEGISFLSALRNSGKGPAANAGGGGMNTNSGGGGGSNGNKGGRGGYEWNGGCPNYLTSLNWGLPGNNLVYNNTSNKIFMGGGGGAGHCNNQAYDPTANADFNGGNGGGIILINADYIKNNNKKIISKGDSAYQLNVTTTYITHDGMGGGGAGGTVLLNNNNLINNLLVDVSGGQGGNMVSIIPAGYIGPGGGGGAGVVWVKQNALPANVIVTNAGGNGGVIVQAGNLPYGATAGQAGINLFSLSVPVDNVLFTKNIDSVRIKDSSTACLAFDFKGFGYTNTNPIASWQWYFGDAGTANTQNASHTYATAGTFTVKLVVTDINGCKDSITRNVISNTMSVNAGSDSSFCGGPVSTQLHCTVTGTGSISWTPAVYLDNNTIANPTATISATTTFYLTITNVSGCIGKDSVTINVDAAPVVQTLNDTAICKGSTLILSTTAGLGTYHWSPGIYVNDSTIANPLFIDTVPRTLIVTGSNGACSAADTINISIKPLPVVYAGADTIICGALPINLSASGASTYSWSPAIFLSNTNSPNPVFSGNASTTYFLTGTGANGCKGKDTVTINVNNPNSLVQPPNKSFCSKETVQLDGANGNTVQYLWSPPTWLSNAALINPVAGPPSSTSYTVTITDAVCNYDSSFIVLITVRPLPLVKASRSNDIDCAIRNSNLTATGAIQYLWQPAGTLSNNSIANPVATPASTTLYVVTGTDNNGCKNKDSVTVQVKDGINAYEIPNSFTPNGDGLNECFGIKHWGNAQNVFFIIYNRWGEKVFETTNVNICWDGTFKGQPAEVGNYVYYARARTSCGDLVKKGNVLLIR